MKNECSTMKLLTLRKHLYCSYIELNTIAMYDIECGRRSLGIALEMLIVRIRIRNPESFFVPCHGLSARTKIRRNYSSMSQLLKTMKNLWKYE